MASDAVDFGKRLRELRDAAGLTQAQLAEQAGLHPQGIVKLETGDREPSWSTLLALAKALNVDINTFAQPPSRAISERGPGRPKGSATAEKRRKPKRGDG